jgi:hypothetical protein
LNSFPDDVIADKFLEYVWVVPRIVRGWFLVRFPFGVFGVVVGAAV